ncbi:MAG: hypothetical protein Q9160_004545 [Pyrenula sp. 1 TL-2023]
MTSAPKAVSIGNDMGNPELLTERERVSIAEKAVEAKEGAYCPHSQFRVGCAILLSSPTDPSNPSSASEPTSMVTGANVENASYPVGICAERCALAYAVASVKRPKLPNLHAIAVSTDIWPPASPCGMCRQFIREFAPKSLPIYMYGSKGVDTYEVRTLDQLLPMSFGPGDLPPKGAPGVS